MCKIWCSILSLLFIASIQQIYGFNVDTVNYVFHNGTNSSMFGFSIALHKEGGRSWVIVGAPKTDTSYFQDKVKNGGAVFQCETTTDAKCSIIRFDEKGHTKNFQGDQIDTKSNQWFGATVVSGGVDGPVLACAPRYVYHMPWPRKVERIEPVGTCFMATNNFRNFTEYSPCRTIYWGYHRQGSCQAGLSASLTKDSERLFIGAPGSWYWQGQIYSINPRVSYPYKPSRYYVFGDQPNIKEDERGQIYSYDAKNPSKYGVFSTGESTAVEDYAYKGYSMTSGDFNGDGVQDVAVGMPRGGGLLGKVLIYNWKMENQKNITGEQIGAYFGYALCSVDVDGDKLDDLIIGAPMHTESNNEGKFEMGRIYIVYQDKTDKFDLLHTRDGVNSRARFGLALTSLQDINLDGYGDFAVGAPYDGPYGQGVVYIYHGSRNGVREKPSQIIHPQNVYGLAYIGIKTFGFALHGGVDIDNNAYPDLVIGAYESDKVFLFRSRPVARIEASTDFEAASKLISLDDKKCRTMNDYKEVTCTTIKSCLKFNGVNLPEAVDVAVSWVLDAKKLRNPRMFFLTDEGKNIRNTTMRLYHNSTECKSEKVYIVDNVRDKLTPLEVEMHYKLRPRKTSYPTVTRKPRSILEPVIDETFGIMQKDSINIQKNCGPENICKPNLKLEITTLDNYLLGSKDLLIIEVLITNFGQDAFEASFYMTLPELVDFKKIEKIGGLRDTPITCTVPTPANNNVLKCDIGNPLAADKVVNFKVIMKPTARFGMKPSFEFYMEANSTNPEDLDNRKDNSFTKTIGVWVETELSIEGTSLPEYFHYDISQYEYIDIATRENQIGPQVVHIYNIFNNGPSTIEETEIYLVVPYKTKAGDILMYILNETETSDNIYCEKIAVNERNLELDEQLSQKSYLESVAAIVKSSTYHHQSQHGERGQSTTNVTVQTYNASSSSGSGYTYTSSAYGKNLTEAQKKQLDAEQNIESTGDSSDMHIQRDKEAAASAAAASAAAAAAAAAQVQAYNQARWQGHGQGQWQGSYGGGTTGSGTSFYNITSTSDGRRILYWQGPKGSGTTTLYNSTHTSDGKSIAQWVAQWQADSSGGMGGITFYNATHTTGGMPFGQWLEQWLAHSSGGTSGITSYNASHTSDGRPIGEWLGQWQTDSSGGTGSTSTMNFFNTSHTSDGRPIVFTQYYNKTTFTGPDGKVHVSETSTEHYGNRNTWDFSLGNKSGNVHSSRGQSESHGGYQAGGSRTGGSQTYFQSGGIQGSYESGASHGNQGGPVIAQAGFGGQHFVPSGTQGHTSTSIRPGGQQSTQTGTYGRTYQTGGSGSTHHTSSQGGHHQFSGSQDDLQQGHFIHTGGQQASQSGGGYSHGSQSANQGPYYASGGYLHGSFAQGYNGTETGELSETSSSGSHIETHGSTGQHSFGTQTGRGHINTQYGFGANKSGTARRIEDIIAEGTISKDILDQNSLTQLEKDGRRRMKSQQDGEPLRPGLITGAIAIDETRGGGSFRTGVVDLGISGSNNVDSEVTQYSSDSQSGRGGSQASTHYTAGGQDSSIYSSGGRGSTTYTSGGQGSSHHSSGGQGSTSYSSSGQGSSYYSSDGGASQYSAGGSSSHHTSQSGGGQTRHLSSSSGSLYGGDKDHYEFSDKDNHEYIYYDDEEEPVDSKSSNNRRFKRDSQNDPDAFNKALSCGPIECHIIKCKAGPLANDEGVWIALRTRVVIYTIHKLSSSLPMKLSTKAVSRVSKLPFIGAPDQKQMKDHELVFTAIPEPVAKPDIVPLWAVVLAACAGVLILLLLVYLLYKCGFFERKRPVDSQERQPLNRNGGYHGDEHL